MAIIGIDFGSKRIGVAVSDALGLAAHGLPTLQKLDEAGVLQAIREITYERGITEAVVGLPRNMDGSIGPQAQETLQFARKLEEMGLSVKMVDERLTTERAHRTMDEMGLHYRERRKRVDRMAAQFILQIYLDSKGAAGRTPNEVESGESIP